jgi:hypothetical protein
MGGIADEHVEWAVVNRLKAMLDAPPKTNFNVTQSFALFSATLLWTKQRAWVGGDLHDRPAWFNDAHALTRADAWVLCGPDTASMRFGVRQGLRDHLVALETLLQDVRYRPAALRANYTSAWLAKTLAELVITEGPKRP